MPALELVEAGVGRECIEDLPGVGQIDAQVADTGVTERHEVAIDDPVPLLDEMSDRMPTRLATAPGEEDSHDHDGTDPARYLLMNHTPLTRCGAKAAVRGSAGPGRVGARASARSVGRSADPEWAGKAGRG